jgi:hypothetical protein
MKKIAFLASLLCATFAMAAPTITGMSQIDLSTSGQTDKYVRFVLADEFSDGFDNTWDTPAPNESGIYVYYAGERYTGWASKQYTASLPLGFYSGENTSYTLKFSNFSGTEYTIYDRVADQIITVNGSTANYNFTIDASLKNSQINDRFIINPVYVEGSWNAWASWSVAFWDNGDGSVICEVENLDANTEYEFGLHFGTQSGSWATNGYTYKSDYKSTADFEHDALAGNMRLQTEAAGTYTFKWEYATRTFSITFPAAPVTGYTVTPNAAGYATFSADEATVIPDGATAYTGTISGEELVLNQITGGYVPANTGVIVAGVAGTPYNFAIYAGSVDAVAGNALKATATYNTSMKNVYVLKGNAFLEYVGTNALAANKAYIQLPTAGQNNAPARISMRFNGTQDVENVETEAVKAEKFVENGQVLIRRGNEVYNLQGQIVK